MSADFLQLYSQLGVSADCSIEDFKHACRRRIGDIHPDRSDTTVVDEHLQMPLDELLALYARALHFHQKHGRLPGASPATGTRAHVPMRPLSQATVDSATSYLATRAPRDSAPTSHRYPMLILVGSILLLTAIAWSSSGREEPVPEDASAEAVVGMSMEHGPQRLELGMDRVAVAAIQGEPLRVDGSRWEYGPSWLHFEDDGLADWYSSPLHPLKTASPHPD